MAAQAHPYSSLPERAFWRPAVAERGPFGLETLWEPRVVVTPTDRVVTFGSCFAQHIGRALKARGYIWHDTERPPTMLSSANARRFNYGVFSARTGNIYTTTLLLQWTRWALGQAPVPAIAWEKDGCWFDPFRPAIEPGGFASADEVRASRARAIAAFADAISEADVFVFTLGLTESWRRRDAAYEYAVCPGTVAGAFDAATDVFENLDYPQIRDALGKAIATMRERNPKLRFILTVSPVPLTATNSGDHVLVATTGSKSVLRAVAGDVARREEGVDYFPSYEIVTSPVMRGMYFAPNARDIVQPGVDFVMRQFFAGMAGDTSSSQAMVEPATVSPLVKRVAVEEDLVCEEELLDAFDPRR